eukprot:TRINITY_DN3155_c0_g1_i1.p1 TRINITY_DN3155_c0_g1~~TRINITY_DN3155_c0_g1_i1.p1  ORF type:complete len:787 (+),score=235.97 TRINITY_DN3155_c0_g1_i1:43-2403(+)
MSQMENVDSRFTHLLQPIRDLAKNWDIDIAADLEAYLEEIGAISAQFDDDEAGDNYKPPNFAEAALVIQGSTLVYSKKVEYLYGLIFRAVDHMIEKTNKKKDGKLASSIGPDGRDMDADGLEEDFELQPIDDLLEEADNIDLDEDLTDQQAMQQSRMSLRFTMALGPSASSSNSGGVDVGLSKDGADFKMNSCIMSESGALLLGGSLDQFQEPLQPLFANVVNPAQLLSPGLSRTMAANATNGIMQQQQQQQPEFRPAALDESDSEDERRRQQQTNLNAPAQAATATGQAQTAAGGASGVVQKVAPRSGARVNKKVDASSMWDTLDPYDQTNIPARPFKRGRTYRKDIKSEPTLTKAESKKQKKLAEINEDPLENLSKSIGANFLKPFFSEFDYLYERISRRRAQERRREIDSRRAGVVAADEAVLLQDEADMHEGFDQQPELWVEPIATGTGFLDEDDEDNGPVADFSGGLTEVNDGPGSNNPIEYQSYEDLCRMHVEKYLKEAETFQQETELSRRVAEWNTRLEPMLKEQESRPPFDIQGYGGEIIKTFVDVKKKKKEDHPSMPFAKLVEANPAPYEVCRNFTAMLQLINNGNLEIQIQKRPGDDPTTTVHQFALKLLSDDYESVAESFKAGGYMVENPEAGGRKQQEAAPEVATTSKKRKQAPAAKKAASGKKGKKNDDESAEESDFGDESEEAEEEIAPKKSAKKSSAAASRPARKNRKTNDEATTVAEEEEYQKRQHLQRLDREDSASDSDNASNKRRGGKQRKRKGAPGAAPEKENLASV